MAQKMVRVTFSNRKKNTGLLKWLPHGLAAMSLLSFLVVWESHTSPVNFTLLEQQKDERALSTTVAKEPSVHRRLDSSSQDVKLPSHVLDKYHLNMTQDRVKLVKGPSTATLATDWISSVWQLGEQMDELRRNHDCVVLQDDLDDPRDPLLVNMLGRYARNIEVRSLETGARKLILTEGKDPAGYPLNDLNHVSAVRVPTIDNPDKVEVWLPCGFHGDQVNHEISSRYARIIDTEMWEVRVGPKLPRAGGACAAVALHLDGPNKPAHICTFGGTDGGHSSGEFMDQVSCYDRVKEAWHHPLGSLPVGLDHANAWIVPEGRCGEDQPARIMVSNYRTEHYGTQSCDILAYDLPPSPEKSWYVFDKCPKDWPGRDAAGLVTTDQGRYVLTFGGVHYHGGGYMDVYKDISLLDICTMDRKTNVGTLDLPRMALQTCASPSLGMTFSCGGQTDPHRNKKLRKLVHNGLTEKDDIKWSGLNVGVCTVNQFHTFTLDDKHEGSLTYERPATATS